MFKFFFIGLHIANVGTIEFYFFQDLKPFHFLGTRDTPHTLLEWVSWTLLSWWFVSCL
jgi:hypothetical protein